VITPACMPWFHTSQVWEMVQCSEAALKRKSDTGVGSAGKRANVSDHKAVPSKMLAVPKGVGAAS
jgi:hypothetical protein